MGQFICYSGLEFLVSLFLLFDSSPKSKYDEETPNKNRTKVPSFLTSSKNA
jgi:hypothetical protein